MNKLCYKILGFYEKRKENINVLFFSAISFIITFYVFATIFRKNNLYPFGETSIAWCDLKQQGIPLLMNLKDALSGDGSLLYSFNNASGMNFWGVFLFFLSNPFSFLCVFFEKNELYKLVAAFVVLKLCLASFTATYALNKIHKSTSKGIHIALGISYALCAYGLMYFQNVMWLDIMYLYPLLVLGIHKITEQKSIALYTVILSLCVIFNFYLSFMVILAVLINIGLYILISKDKKENKKKAAFNLFIGSAIAAFVSAISWIPAFIQYSSSGRGEDLFETLSNSSWNTSKNTIYLLLLSSAILVIGLLSLIKPDRKRVSTLIAFVLFSIPIFVEPINKMWHTGSYMSFPGRYAFITIFTGLQLVALALEQTKPCYLFAEEDEDEEEKPEKNNESLVESIKNKISYLKENATQRNVVFIVISLVAVVITVNYLLKNVSIGIFEENKEALSKFTKTLWGDTNQLELTWSVAKTFGIVYIIYATLFKFRLFPKKIFSLFLIGTVVCEGVFAVNAYAVTLKDRNIFNTYETFLDLEGKIEDEDFYRIKTEKKYWDSNLLGALGYNSIGHYTSLTNSDYMNAYKALGYSSSWMELSTYGGTELSNAILSVRYNVVRKKLKDSVYTNGTFSIEETFASLGLGVKYSGKNDVFTSEEFSRTDFQEKIFASLFGGEEKLFEKYEPDSTSNCTITKDGKNTHIHGLGEIVYNVDVKGEQSLYFDAFGEFSNNLKQQIDKGFEIHVNNLKVATFPDGMYTGLVSLGTFKDEKVNVKIVTKKSYMSLISFGVSGLKKDLLKEKVDAAESGFIQTEGNKAFGTVDGKNGEYLFVSIPYDEGFKVTVNGKKADVKRVFGDFYSIPLTDGKNEIEMKYTPPGFVMGVIITLIGIAAFALWLIYSKKINSKSASDKAQAVASPIFVALFALVIVAIYLMPVLVKMYYKV